MPELGLIGASEVERETRRVGDELDQKGFVVLDHKPQHVIVRPQGDRLLRHRDGTLAYVLVDFELLERTNEYLEHLRATRT